MDIRDVVTASKMGIWRCQPKGQLDIICPGSIKASLAGSQKDLFPNLPSVGLSQAEVL